MAYKFNEIKLDKGMYSERGRSFAQVLENLDPSENYKGTAYEGLDAYQRQLKRFDIKVKGAGSDCVEKFFSTGESSVLFPEYVARSVRTGMEENNIIPSLVASVTKIDSLDYRSIYSDVNDEDKALREVEEGGEIPTTEVRSASNLVRLIKRGRMLVASYEAIRFQRLDLFSVMLRQIGSHIAAMHLEDAIEVLMNGDGNENAAEILSVGGDTIGGTAGKLSYSELLAFWNQFENYNLNTILASPAVMLQLLSCPEFQNPLTGLNFIGTGEPGSPMGAKLIRSNRVPEGKLIGLDRNYALEMVTAGDVSVEYDRLIDKQLERAAITSISGFAKLYYDASKVLAV
ncbi:MAG: phage major capsid protein [Oscillospiraceae bacterium]|nr:phage major capsid protein [Oscillospiraceae bacterium]